MMMPQQQRRRRKQRLLMTLLVHVVVLALKFQASSSFLIVKHQRRRRQRSNNSSSGTRTRSSSSGSGRSNILILQAGGKKRRTNIELPILVSSAFSSEPAHPPTPLFVPLPSSEFPDELTTPFVYGLQLDTPLHQLIIAEAIATATTTTTTKAAVDLAPWYGHLVWQDEGTLIGAIGCAAEILVNTAQQQAGTSLNKRTASSLPQTPFQEKVAQLEQSFSASRSEDEKDGNAKDDSNNDNDDDDGSVSISSTPTTTNVVCRGGWRFVVKDVVKTIPYPVVIVDEIFDDADDDDSAMFSKVGTTATHDDKDEDTDLDTDPDDYDHIQDLSVPELIRTIMRNVQSIVRQKLEEAIARTQLNPLEQSILEESLRVEREGKDDDDDEEEGTKISSIQITPAVIELAHSEEMSAVWEVFQTSLVDDFEPSQRRFAVAMMAAELVDLNQEIREEILVIRNGKERLQLVAKEVQDLIGMARARKVAIAITNQNDDTEKDLQVGTPQLPTWTKQIHKGTRVEYYWNDEWKWCAGVVVDDPVTIIDELLITLRFEDGEIHRLPFRADEKVRWRPPTPPPSTPGGK